MSVSAHILVLPAHDRAVVGAWRHRIRGTPGASGWIRGFFPLVERRMILEVRPPDLVLGEVVLCDGAGNEIEHVVCSRFRNGSVTEQHMFDVEDLDDARAQLGEMTADQQDAGLRQAPEPADRGSR
jgi:hypothetical protein